jgi:hypothetical protein
MLGVTLLLGHSSTKTKVYALSRITSEPLGMTSSVNETAPGQAQKLADSTDEAHELQGDAADKSNSQRENLPDETTGGAARIKSEGQDKVAVEGVKNCSAEKSRAEERDWWSEGDQSKKGGSSINR